MTRLPYHMRLANGLQVSQGPVHCTSNGVLQDQTRAKLASVYSGHFPLAHLLQPSRVCGVHPHFPVPQYSALA